MARLTQIVQAVELLDLTQRRMEHSMVAPEATLAYLADLVVVAPAVQPLSF
jgi:hypothetical protein